MSLSRPGRTSERNDLPVVLTVAGSDSGGGAGIQADIKTCEALGAFCTTAIVALTAQNTLGVQDAFPMTPSIVRAQIESVLSDMGAQVVLTGMLPTADIIETVSSALEAHDASVRVIDPVGPPPPPCGFPSPCCPSHTLLPICFEAARREGLCAPFAHAHTPNASCHTQPDRDRVLRFQVFIAASGDWLVGAEAMEAIKTKLIPSATIITPNLAEAKALLGVEGEVSPFLCVL